MQKWLLNCLVFFIKMCSAFGGFAHKPFSPSCQCSQKIAALPIDIEGVWVDLEAGDLHSVFKGGKTIWLLCLFWDCMLKLPLFL